MLNIPIHLPPEGRITKTHTQTIDRQLIQQLGCGNPLQVVSVEPEPLDHRIPHGWGFVVDDLAELTSGGGFLVFAEGIFEERPQEPGAKQRAA